MALRRRSIIAALAALVVIAAGSLSWPATHLPFARQLVGRIEAATGLDVAIERSSLRLLPSPRLKISRVSLSSSGAGTADAVLLRAREVRIGLKAWPFLFGRAEPSSVTLINPQIRWLGPEHPHQIWALTREHLSALVAASNATPDSADSRRDVAALAAMLPSRIAISEGAVLYRTGNRRLMQRVNAAVNWPSVGRPLEATASALWRGEPVDLRIDKLLPASLAAGFASPVSARLSARPATFSFSGTVSADLVPRFTGDVAFRTRSLRQTAAWLRTPLAFADVLGQLAIKGSVSLSGDGLSIPDARIDTGGGALEGALAARTTAGGRVHVSATLDAGTLDFNRIFMPDRFPAPARPQGGGTEWPRTPLVNGSGDAGRDSNDLDIRLSVARARAGPLTFQEVAAGILAANGKLEVALNQARLGDGLVKGRLQLLPDQDGLSAQLAGAFEGVDARATLLDLTGTPFLSGEAGGQVVLRGAGRSVKVIMRGLSGQVSARITDGELSTVDLNSVVRRMEQRPLATALDWRGGRTPFETIEANLQIDGGVGAFEGRMHGHGGLDGVMSGIVDIAERTLALRAVAMAAKAGEGSDSPAFPIEIEGSWDYPVVTPDIRSLIERSNATVPAVSPGGDTGNEKPR